MIVKVQLSITSSDGKKRILISDRNKKHIYETDKPEEVEHVLRVLKDQQVAFFKADFKDGNIHLLNQVFINKTW